MRALITASPHLLTGLRLLIALPFASALDRYELSLAVGLLSVAIITDVLDGWIARKLNTCSAFGAYFDAIADLALVAGAFGVLVVRGVYPVWVLVIIALMFGQFVLTSACGRLVYDPVGKYYGAALYGVIVALVLVPDLLLSYALLAVIIMLSVLSFSTRTFWLIRTLIL